MTPTTDNTQHIADTLAILTGKESVYTLNMDMTIFCMMYTTALELLKDNHIALLQDGMYTIVKHSPKWKRRVR